MIMIRAIVRPEKTPDILKELSAAGFPAVTKMDVAGRGKQRGVVVGDVFYDEIPKEMLIFAVEDSEEDTVCDIIARNARTGERGSFGDGKIFVNKITRAITISTGKEGL